ncbi:MAG: SPOR domain-containing protein [Phenylobacterium sp.]|uniref:SPOR domain-containing protein n=1 Tax=Phenylobacterium sp. TaxID=1871053 RepID=UPI001A612A45|nr:SPOR domain-containing protein [Phenylobacterium sp.]MBL8552646.1 SPOR domain-containing protein [Phenylobacterium sp.]
MSDHERGAYAPPTSDAPLSFDPRQPVRGARPIPFTLILSVLVLAALVAAIFVFYQQGVRQAGEAPQVVGAPVAGMKEAAPAGAQPQDGDAQLQIYREEAGGPVETLPAEPRFTAPPEQPQARPTTPVVVAQIPPAQAAPAPKAASVAPPPAATAAALKPTIPAAPPPKAAAPAQKVQAAAPVPAKPAAAKPVAAAPALKPVPPPVEKKPATPEPKAAVASGAARVQVGAVSSTALADKAWSDAVSAAPGLAAGKGKAVEKIEGGSLYRTFVTGFASKADAQAFCARLQGAGKSCFVR